jgi:hypothetical protein
MENYGEIVQTFFNKLKSYSNKSHKSLITEMNLLGMSIDQDVAVALSALVRNSSSMKEAVDLAGSMSRDSLLSYVSSAELESVESGFVLQDSSIISKRDAKKRDDERKKEILREEEEEKGRSARHAMLHSDNTYMSEYKICAAANLFDLQKEVNWWMTKSGYVPIGGVCTYPLFAGVRLSASEHDRFFQAMVKYDYK